MPAFGAHLHHLLMTVRSAPVRVLALTLVALLVFVFRYNVLTTFYIAQTYLTWYRFSSGVLTTKDNFDTTMASYPRNQTSAAPNYTDVVPPIIHHIVIGNIDLTKRPKWIAARDACLQWHPGYEYRFWNDSSAEELIRQEYPWFLDTWKSYKYPIQRADSLRYLVLYRYGGIFLDMDLHCRRALGPLRRFDFVSPAAYPVGISNGFLMASARHPFIKVLVEQLPLFNRNFLLPYATVMFSTGCMYISAQYSLYSDRCRLRLLDYKIHRLSGHVSTPLFDHEGSSSWHAGDASFIKRADHFLNRLFRHRSLVLMNFFVFVIVIAVVLHRRKSKSRDPLEKPLLTEKI